MDSQISTDSQESYASGKFAGRGFFCPARNAQYNFIVQKFKHRKEYKRELKEETDLQIISRPKRRSRVSSNASRKDSSDVDEFRAIRYN